MSNGLLIGLAGRARSGKDTVGDWLETQYGFERTAFASPLKTGVRAMFGLTRAHTDGDLKEEVIPHLGVSPRQLMQWLGTEYGRDLIGPTVWIDVVLERWRALCGKKHNPLLVVTDVRFNNEAEALRQQGGVIIHIERPDLPEVAAHTSEQGVEVLPDDMLICNDSTLDDLLRKVNATLDML